MRGKSLYSDDPECWICHNPMVHVHHIYPGAGRRPISDREGCWVYLCPYHHNMSNHGVHFDKELDAFFRSDCQRRWERREGISDQEHRDFIALMGRNYLEEE